MDTFSIFQQNNLFIGTQLAVELLPSSPERRAFLKIGSYVKTPEGAWGRRPSKVFNIDQPDPNLRFWMRMYELNNSAWDPKSDLEFSEGDLIEISI